MTKPTFSRALDGIVVVLIVVATAYVEIGFFCPDGFVFGAGSHALVRAALWICRMGALLIGVSALFIYVRVRQGRMRAGFVLVGALISLILVSAAYLPANTLYQRMGSEKRKEFHPYLQLAPPAGPQAQKRAGVIRVVCLGGSTTEFTDSSGLGWPERVQLLLDKQDSRVEMVNFGRQWYTTLHVLHFYETTVRLYKPDVVIVMEAVNDLLQNADFSYFSTGPFREDYGHFLGPVARLITAPDLISAAPRIARQFWYAPNREVVNTDSFPGLSPYQRNVRTLASLVRADGARMILMTQPYLEKPVMTAKERASLIMLNREALGPHHRWSLATAVSAFRQYNDVLRDTARDLDALLIDLEAHTPKTLEYIYDDVHYTDKGFLLVSGLVAEGLKSSGLLTVGPVPDAESKE